MREEVTDVYQLVEDEFEYVWADVKGAISSTLTPSSPSRGGGGKILWETQLRMVSQLLAL